MPATTQVSRAATCLVVLSVFTGACLWTVPTAAQLPQAPISEARVTPTVKAIRRASPAVVNIHGQKTVRATAAGMAGAEGPDSFRQVNGMGTGVVIDPRGYVITNYHVVEDVDNIKVTLHDGETTTAELIASRVRNDLALIRVKSDRPLPTIPRGTSSDLMAGESVIAIGNAFGYVHTSTQGIISALHRDVPVNETQEYVDLIQISAGINPGNSGGPLLNIEGEMIGVNVAVRVGAQQIAFAIPIDQVVEIVTEMIEQQNDSRLAIGLRTSGGPREGDGVTVSDVSASSPAAREGLKPGDRVVRVGSQEVDNKLDFSLALMGLSPGDAMQLEIERGGERFDLALTTERRTADSYTVKEARISCREAGNHCRRCIAWNSWMADIEHEGLGRNLEASGYQRRTQGKILSGSPRANPFRAYGTGGTSKHGNQAPLSRGTCRL